jgi:hypothetical protein
MKQKLAKKKDIKSILKNLKKEIDELFRAVYNDEYIMERKEVIGYLLSCLEDALGKDC